eukprot:5698431-Pyramimonas_sp.AAC.1
MNRDLWQNWSRSFRPASSSCFSLSEFLWCGHAGFHGSGSVQDAKGPGVPRRVPHVERGFQERPKK